MVKRWDILVFQVVLIMVVANGYVDFPIITFGIGLFWISYHS